MLHTAQNNYDIICIQEPHFDHLKAMQATPVWHLVTPTGWNRNEPNEKTPRAIILVHTWLSTNSWMQIDLESPNAVAIKILGEEGEISIYNIYNDCTHSEMLMKFQEHLEERE